MTLAIKDLELETVTKPKQTATTQRWKVSLRARGSSSLTWTRIEFSRRSRDSRNELEQVPPELAERFALRSPTTRHYLPSAAAEQKVKALAERTETQARDIFDLDHLLKQYPQALERGSVSPESVATAIGNALGLPFEAYQNQVIRFLDAAVVEMYDRVEAWQDMQRNVLEKLRILE
ncbi:MAG TPA: nucleotidyl transferase AbiEii/AbiGii toxin family protein [bacterium]|jgi:hypothetical protein|nr:nucleotidyl transferase AbiEii/AbiGii toxin family protein [bacterium]